MREFTQEEADRHNALAAKGWELMKGQLLVQGAEPIGQPESSECRRLELAIDCFEQALEINPEGWPSMWALG